MLDLAIASFKTFKVTFPDLDKTRLSIHVCTIFIFALVSRHDFDVKICENVEDSFLKVCKGRKCENESVHCCNLVIFQSNKDG